MGNEKKNIKKLHKIRRNFFRKEITSNYFIAIKYCFSIDKEKKIYKYIGTIRNRFEANTPFEQEDNTDLQTRRTRTENLVPKYRWLHCSFINSARRWRSFVLFVFSAIFSLVFFFIFSLVVTLFHVYNIGIYGHYYRSAYIYNS